MTSEPHVPDNRRGKAPIQLKIDGKLRLFKNDPAPREWDQQVSAAKEAILRLGPGERAIVYCRRTAQCDALSVDYRWYCYHAQMTEEGRAASLEGWRRFGTVIAATTVLGLGVDTQHVALVIILGKPFSLSEMAQQMGRARRSRGMATANAILACDDEQDPHLRLFTDINGLPEQFIDMAEQKFVCLFDPFIHSSTSSQRSTSDLRLLRNAIAQPLPVLSRDHATGAQCLPSQARSLRTCLAPLSLISMGGHPNLMFQYHEADLMLTSLNFSPTLPDDFARPTAGYLVLEIMDDIKTRPRPCFGAPSTGLVEYSIKRCP
ncbi:hypothetical protein ACJ41O_005510 [Fusarium nematophilum]